MQLEIPPDLEALIQKRLSSGAYANAEDVVRRAVQEQDAQDVAMDADLAAHLEQGIASSRTGQTH